MTLPFTLPMQEADTSSISNRYFANTQSLQQLVFPADCCYHPSGHSHPSIHCPLTSVRISAGTPVAMRMVQSCCKSPQWNMAFWQLLVAPGGFVGDTRTRTSYRGGNMAMWREPGTFWTQNQRHVRFHYKTELLLKMETGDNEQNVYLIATYGCLIFSFIPGDSLHRTHLIMFLVYISYISGDIKLCNTPAIPDSPVTGFVLKAARLTSSGGLFWAEHLDFTVVTWHSPLHKSWHR